MRLRLGAAVIIVAFASGCAGFGPVTPADRVLAGDEPRPEEWQRTRFTVDIDGPGLSGVYEAVAIASTRRPRLRLQLFPDVGGKILDLVVTERAIRGAIAQADISYEQPLPLDAAARPHLLLVLAVTMLERGAAVSAGRLRGGRDERGGRELALAPLVPGSSVTAVFRDGSLRARRLAAGPMAWSLEDDVARAPGMTIRITERGREPLAEVPAAVFDHGTRP